MPQKKRKKRLIGIGVHVGAFCPIRPNVLWAMDFQFDHTIDGKQVKMLNIIDEHTREARPSEESPRSKHLQAIPAGTASHDRATDNSTEPSTQSSEPE